MNNTFYLKNEEALLQFGECLAIQFRDYLNKSTSNSLVIYLNGELGAGKTTLTRSIVRTFGHQGNVKSPTYTLVEEYILPPFSLYHFDLYRLADPEELEFMGIRDYFKAQTLCLLEWANCGLGMIPPADFIIQLDYAEQGRNLQLLPQNAKADELFRKFLNNQTACKI
ncbi:tRNA (N6-adenosine(37)-N6)-threonylcarbamoyltransferase complex ATPase TsaE [Vespertiliibacter pulmonis]|uniref:tRNA threonylcarbamoyladenosine biosynthesis protein TsaE n=1 Tax=Vespertiliibacter pulmonis TaxID=1443036 RepID=A0A3N4VH06_9PAST|nr:tRNA (adenosine(37)-N6)-threonylcarbamoyltransferase complex ATPase subunit type 1 TsaE [Vespertiliibacter pulmonis]QLB20482.1 tRNA (N6-adenosine(37)-N6)-threonylcarbamoyltransferase complex ATPase TsaE [Vespertiliibacter pulmonis]RPE80785.1 tRNA threonylcarbamoyladenosine biosynthesis protein TsaE [Vespertiliibacter pulmonis]